MIVIRISYDLHNPRSEIILSYNLHAKVVQWSLRANSNVL